MPNLIASINYNNDGTTATIQFEDGSEEVRVAGDEGLDFSDLWFRDAATGEITLWGEDGAYETTEGFVRL